MDGDGLIGGTSTAIGDRARVVGVEPELTPTMARTLEADELIDVRVGGIAADSLGARRFGAIAFEAVKKYGVRSVLVGEDAIVAACNAL